LYETLGLDFIYKAFTTRNLPDAIAGIRALGIRGCAISMPFKEDVIPLLDGMHSSASAIQSVNTILNDDGRLVGYNTDYSAVRSLLAMLPDERSRPFVLKGSGGMAKAVATALRDEGFTTGTIVARNKEKGRALAASLGFRWRATSAGLQAPIIINVTPIGMTGPNEEELAFDVGEICDAAVVVDAVARPVETPLLRLARKSGKCVIPGSEIAKRQSLAQFVLYTGTTPTPAQVADAEAYALRTG